MFIQFTQGLILIKVQFLKSSYRFSQLLLTIANRTSVSKRCNHSVLFEKLECNSTTNSSVEGSLITFNQYLKVGREYLLKHIISCQRHK